MRSQAPVRNRRDPPSDGPRDGGGGGGWRLLTVAKDVIVAHLIEGLLIEHGVESFLDATDASPGAFMKPFGDPLAPVKVYVHAGDFETASLALMEVDHQPTDLEAKPPKRLKVRWIMTIITIMAVALLLLLEIVGFAPCILKLFCF